RQNLLARWAREFLSAPDEAFGDTFLQPVEHTYTVESLDRLAAECELVLLHPRICTFDKLSNRFFHNARFDDSRLRSIVESMPDMHRWEFANQILFDESPMLWFYLQRQDSPFPRVSEQAACEGFLDSIFVRNVARLRTYRPGTDGEYHLDPEQRVFPGGSPTGDAARVLCEINGEARMMEIFNKLGLARTFSNVQDIRLRLTTSAFPYLRVRDQIVAPANGPGSDISEGKDIRQAVRQPVSFLRSPGEYA